MIETDELRAARANSVALYLPIAERYKASGGSAEDYVAAGLRVLLEEYDRIGLPTALHIKAGVMEHAAIAFAEIVARVWGIDTAVEVRHTTEEGEA